MKHQLLISVAALGTSLVLDSATVAAAAAARDAAPAAPWFKRALVGMEVGPTGAQFAGGKHAPDYAANFNGAEIVRRCAAANAEYLVLWVRDGEFTFHDSKLVPKPDGQRDRDVLREAVEEGRRLGLPIVAYCQLQYPAHELRQHPEWKARQADGKLIDHLVCFNSPYTNVVKALLAEMLDYGIAGFHLDMVDQGFGPPHGCWCDHCQQLFQAEYGRPMPRGVNWEDEDWDRLLQFRYATSDRFEKMLTDYIRSLDPRATVDFNYHGNPPFSWEVGQTPVRHAGNGDFVTGEAGLWAFGALLGEARTKREQFGHTPVREVGIYFSTRTRDWIGRDKPATYFQSVQGAHKACVYEHLGFGFLFDENLSLEGLQQFPVVCLPNTGILSEHEVDLFHRYVADGGTLLVTGQSGQSDRLGKPLGASTLEDLIGARVKRRLEGADNWMRFSQEEEASKDLAAGLRPDWPFLVRGPATVYEPVTATPSGQLLDSHRAGLANPQGYNADWPLSARQVVGPAVLVHSVGKGTVLTFAASPDFATASEHHIVEARKLVANAVRRLHPEPRVHITAPASVEAVVTDDPATRTLRVHLIAYNAPPQTTPVKERPYVLPGLIEDAPMFRATIELRGGLKSAMALNRTTKLKKRGNRVELTVADIYEIIQCRY